MQCTELRTSFQSSTGKIQKDAWQFHWVTQLRTRGFVQRLRSPTLAHHNLFSSLIKEGLIPQSLTPLTSRKNECFQFSKGCNSPLLHLNTLLFNARGSWLWLYSAARLIWKVEICYIPYIVCFTSIPWLYHMKRKLIFQIGYISCKHVIQPNTRIPSHCGNIMYASVI